MLVEIRRAAVIASVALLSVGCEEGRDARRLKLTRNQYVANLLYEDGGQRSAVRAAVRGQLDRMSVNDLRDPKLSAALYIDGDSERGKMLFWWIENSPSIDGVLIRDAIANAESAVKLSDLMMEAIRSGAADHESSVVHAGKLIVPPELQPQVEERPGDFSIAGTKRGQAVTNFVPLSILRAGR